MNIQIINITLHPNGTTGAPFHSVVFGDPEGVRRLAIVFEPPGHFAVLDIVQLVAGGIALNSSTQRGEKLEPSLRTAIDQWWFT
jgi:hypothetical protein